MNLGLGNLAELKAQVLGDSLAAETAYDPMITAIGRGVAALFEKFCNRQFERVVDEVYTCNAERDHLFLPRYPLEAVSKVELRVGMEAWQTLADAVQQSDPNGLVHFGAELGNYMARLRITYTGGYWFDTTEDGSGIKPAAATLLPADLKLAWFLQVKHVWEGIDKLGVSLVKAQNVALERTLGGLELVPQVKASLQNFVRYNIS